MGRLGGLADRGVREAMRLGMRKGMGEGSRVWLSVGAAAVGIRLLQRLASPGKPTVVCEELAPGQSLLITHFAEDR